MAPIVDRLAGDRAPSGLIADGVMQAPRREAYL